MKTTYPPNPAPNFNAWQRYIRSQVSRPRPVYSYKNYVTLITGANNVTDLYYIQDQLASDREKMNPFTFGLLVTMFESKVKEVL